LMRPDKHVLSFTISRPHVGSPLPMTTATSRTSRVAFTCANVFGFRSATIVCHTREWLESRCDCVRGSITRSITRSVMMTGGHPGYCPAAAFSTAGVRGHTSSWVSVNLGHREKTAGMCLKVSTEDVASYSSALQQDSVTYLMILLVQGAMLRAVCPSC
jgi:hypothetical protein